ncbi:hypothetical protein ACHAXR_000615 [Thalassiosira sp. AJA248-18]
MEEQLQNSAMKDARQKEAGLNETDADTTVKDEGDATMAGTTTTVALKRTPKFVRRVQHQYQVHSSNPKSQPTHINRHQWEVSSSTLPSYPSYVSKFTWGSHYHRHRGMHFATLRNCRICILDLYVVTARGIVPIYLIHGMDDEVVPILHGRLLHHLLMDKKTKGFPPFYAEVNLLDTNTILYNLFLMQRWNTREY